MQLFGELPGIPRERTRITPAHAAAIVGTDAGLFRDFVADAIGADGAAEATRVEQHDRRAFADAEQVQTPAADVDHLPGGWISLCLGAHFPGLITGAGTADDRN